MDDGGQEMAGAGGASAARATCSGVSVMVKMDCSAVASSTVAVIAVCVGDLVCCFRVCLLDMYVLI